MEVQNSTELNNSELILVKRLIWTYILLLILEGALRKWVLPELSQPLLIVRDPIAILLMFYSWIKGIWTPTPLIYGVFLITLFSLILTLLVGHGNLLVAMYGARITLLHFPLIFLFGKVLDMNDLISIGKCLIYVSIAMTLLVALQFFSPQSAWVNRGIAGDLSGSGFSGAAGFFRVPGTFSFTNGLTSFYGLVAPLIMYFWIGAQDKINNVLLICATIAFIVVIPMTISRTLIFTTVLSFIFLVGISLHKPKIIGRVIFTLVAIVLIVILLSNFNFFNTAVSAIQQRFENANAAEGGVQGTIVNRFLGGLYESIIETEINFFGKGLGLGTNVGASLFSGKRQFLLAEGEWGRLIGEMGYLLGLLLISIRMSIVIGFSYKSWNQLKYNNYLPWLILSSAALMVAQGNWAQPTSLGFAVVSGGLLLASLNIKNNMD